MNWKLCSSFDCCGTVARETLLSVTPQDVGSTKEIQAFLPRILPFPNGIVNIYVLFASFLCTSRPSHMCISLPLWPDYLFRSFLEGVQPVLWMCCHSWCPNTSHTDAPELVPSTLWVMESSLTDFAASAILSTYDICQDVFQPFLLPRNYLFQLPSLFLSCGSPSPLSPGTSLFCDYCWHIAMLTPF